MTSSDYDVHIDRLRRIGRSRARALRRVAALEIELAGAIVAADGAGVPRLTIAQVSGLARQTVYASLEREGAHIREPVQP